MSRRGQAEALAARERLFVSGEVAAAGGRLLLLLSPDEPGFWPHFEDSAEARDGAPEPLDRWSRRIITGIAEVLGGSALFPFGGPPWHPFPDWALASGEAWISPVGLLVHARSGLFISYRGAIALEGKARPAEGPPPCAACPQPCRTACPVDAFAGGRYDVARCKAWLETEPGRDCYTRGCRVRRACPVGAGLRLPEQSAFHMRAFHPDAA